MTVGKSLFDGDRQHGIVSDRFDGIKPNLQFLRPPVPPPPDTLAIHSEFLRDGQRGSPICGHQNQVSALDQRRTGLCRPGQSRQNLTLTRAHEDLDCKGLGHGSLLE
jgi:hypothetical protein